MQGSVTRTINICAYNKDHMFCFLSSLQYSAVEYFSLLSIVSWHFLFLDFLEKKNIKLILRIQF